ncbi:MAG: hypothetical protein AAB215_03320 [Planctomycetota bacterium]
MIQGAFLPRIERPLALRYWPVMREDAAPLGIAKTGLDEMTMTAAKNEADTLKYLQGVKRDGFNAPSVILEGSFEGNHYFVQSMLQGAQAPASLFWDERYEKAAVELGRLAEKFDLITTFRFVLNAEEGVRERALRALAPLLRDENSRLIFKVHGNRHSYRHFARFLHRIGLGQKDSRFNELSRVESIALAERCGLRVVRVRGMGFIPRMASRLLPSFLWMALERTMASMPWIWRFGVNLVFVCRKA